ncbi:MAG: M24 family metallopeptidase [Gaiellaceae bacterium]
MSDRYIRVQQAAAEEGLDCLLLTSPASIAYVSGFHAKPYERLIAALVPVDGPVCLVVPSLEEEAARAASDGETQFHVWRDEDGPAAALTAALERPGLRVGIEKGHLTVQHYELVSSRPRIRLDGCDALIARLRMAKDPDELELHRRAAAVVDRGLARLASEIRPGRTEAELASVLTQILPAEGADDVGFAPAVLAGANAALPHGSPGRRELASGDLLIVDIGAAVGGYHADITRTYVVGAEPDPRQRELFELVREAQRAGIAAAKPETPCREIDRAARSVIEAAGLGAHFVHRTGHGLGLEVHEPPSLHAQNAEPLPEGAVITVEPGVYLPGYGGVRIEDDVAVTGSGPEVLTRAPIGLEVA